MAGMEACEGRRVVVTAGAGGIGRVIAEAFASRGARVHVCDVDEAAIRALGGNITAIRRTSPTRGTWSAS